MPKFEEPTPTGDAPETPPKKKAEVSSSVQEKARLTRREKKIEEELQAIQERARGRKTKAKTAKEKERAAGLSVERDELWQRRREIEEALSSDEPSAIPAGESASGEAEMEEVFRIRKAAEALEKADETPQGEGGEKIPEAEKEEEEKKEDTEQRLKEMEDQAAAFAPGSSKRAWYDANISRLKERLHGPETRKEPTPERREDIEAYEEIFRVRREKIQEEAEQKGVWKFMKGAFEKYRKLPLYQKIAIGMTLTGGVFAGASLGGPAGAALSASALTAKAALGGIASIASYMGVKEGLEKSREKGERWWNKHPSAWGAAVGALTGALAAYGVGEGIEAGLEAGVAGAAGGVEGGGIGALPVSAAPEAVASPAEAAGEIGALPPEAPPEAVVSAGAFTAEVASGDTVWGLLGESVKEHIAGLSPEQQTYVIDGLKDKLVAMSPEELRGIGIASGDIDKIQLGETIDFSSVLRDPSVVEHLKEQAQNLTPAQIESIREAMAGPEAAPSLAETAPQEIGALPHEAAPETVAPQAEAPAEAPVPEIYFDKVAPNVYQQEDGSLISWGGGDSERAALAEKVAAEQGKAVRVDGELGSYMVNPDGSRVSIEEKFGGIGDWFNRLFGSVPEPKNVSSMITHNR